jgi:5-methylcytosine-specific restriction protein B
MAIIAIRTVKENPGDGRTLRVEWKTFDPLREWNFYANRYIIWRHLPGDWTTDALVGIMFEQNAQDINCFSNVPYWRDRFADGAFDKRCLALNSFFEAAADKLRAFCISRDEILAKNNAISGKIDCISNPQDQIQACVPAGLLKNISPFTAIKIFNIRINDANCKTIANYM